MRKIFITVFLLVMSLSITGCSLNKNNSSTNTSPEVKGAETKKIPFDIVKDGYYLGPVDAKVIIVEFSDFQCPACAKMSTIIKSVVDNYPKDVKLVYRNFPLSYHQYAMKAAESAEAAGLQGKYWPMHDLIFANNTKLSNDIFTKFAQDLGLNMDQFNKDVNSQAVSDKIKRDIDVANSTLMIGGTPTFYINNVEYNGEYSFNGFKKEIDIILAEK